ncbi:MAG: NTP transferase domain-containing protein [Olegusella sp.]|nr:NTP transferase domain-containing protein [Olsenella sp.]MCC6102501.1 NTP transferase domain-containing protein [Olegusella sp.]
MLDRYEFEVLSRSDGKRTQRQIAQDAGISVGSVNQAVARLQQKGLLDAAGAPTEAAPRELAPYKVDNAVILAAGAATRFAPLSYERPKGLFKVRGEVLIERLIRQLREAGVQDVYVVVGYMKESFFYLEDKLGVHIIVSPDYAKRNNHASLAAARSVLGRSYVCSSDQYLDSNVFTPYCYGSWVSAVPADEAADGYHLRTNRDGRVTAMDPDGAEPWVMEGPAFFDADASSMLVGLIGDAWDEPETKGKLWDDFLAENLDKLSVRMRALPARTVHEFDYIHDLAAFDADFFENVDSRILDNICETLHCERADITEVEPLKAGLTNLSVLFNAKGKKYIYRHPGPGTEKIVNRQAETYALGVARDLGLDTTYVHEDPEGGWKISSYIEGCEDFDYRNPAHVRQALSILRRLHTSDAKSPWSFDFYEEARRIEGMLREARYPLPDDFDELAGKIGHLAAQLPAEAGEPVLCHNDFYGPNLLVKGDRMELIDWEYAAMGDYGCDIGNFVAQGSGYSPDEAESILSLYFGREPTAAETRHCMACTAVVGWYWYVWSIYKEMQGNPVGEWLYVWYKAAKQFCAHALPMYEGIEEQAPASGKLSRAEFDRLVAREAEGAATPDELAALEPYRARRAILFAAGYGSRMRPITINTPKPLVRVHGTRIIDRLIDALLAVGVDEIYVVRGYLAESFDQLKSKYPTVRFIDNPLFDSTNNISSALAAKDLFRNAYAFESDLLLENPALITKYQYETNYLAIPVDETDDWYFDADDQGYITHIAKGKDAPCWKMVGCSYWTAEDGARLAQDIPAVFAEGGRCRQIFWDDVALDRRPEHYRVRVRECSADDITEIDSFAELQQVDEAYRIGGEE